MATSGRQTNTLDEYIQKMMRLISDAKTVTANDPRGLEFLIGLETTILKYVAQPMQEAGMDTSGMVPDQGAMMGGGAGMAAGSPPGGQMSPAMGAPMPQPGAGVNPQAGPADELRRLLTSRNGQAPTETVKRLMR